MRALEQVKDHLIKVGYDKREVPKIMGFLIGKGLKDIHTRITINAGGFCVFEDFIDWFGPDNSKSKDRTSDLSEETANTLEDALDSFICRAFLIPDNAKTPRDESSIASKLKLQKDMGILQELQTILEKFEDLIAYMDENNYDTSDVDRVYALYVDGYRKRFDKTFNK